MKIEIDSESCEKIVQEELDYTIKTFKNALKAAKDGKPIGMFSYNAKEEAKEVKKFLAAAKLLRGEWFASY